MKYHILNGDALFAQFPESIPGERIVCRECLVDGPVAAGDLASFFQVRARFIAAEYGDYSEKNYRKDSLSQFERILNLPAEAEVNLWFEDDLFCQVNFWFVCRLLVSKPHTGCVYLIRPPEHTQYGFGALDSEQLVDAFSQKIEITDDLDGIANLWSAYQDGDTMQLSALGSELKERFPFVGEAVDAHLDRLPVEGRAGRPERVLREIIDELGADDFGKVFRRFCERESIYGFGDLQVKRMFDKLVQRREE